MYYTILVLPLLSSIVAGLGGRYIGEKGASILTTTSIIITSILSLTVFYEVGLCGSPTYVDIWSWMDTGNMNIRLGLQFDSLTASMLILVTIVSGLVHLYSTEYMAGDPHKPRFMSYLSLFTFFMIVLVTSDNILQLFIGWEGVGVCSYLLINFWFTRIQANKSAINAMIMNRIGDVGIALGIFTVYYVFRAIDYSTIFSMAPLLKDASIVIWNWEIHAYTLIGIFFLIGAAGKSAQLGLHTWLPQAMEGPTPVSALIHAATMVTAGVFLIIRTSPLLEYAPQALIAIAIVGALTALFAATVGLVQNDIKKVIAYSTCSQLGYMVFACGISNYSVSIFHLVNHGFFKALLFLSAGCVIHGMADEQDMRKYGGLIKTLPMTYSLMLIGSLSLMGFPFLTGFYSKDAILELAYAKYNVIGTFSHWLGTLSALFTAFYSLRLLYLTFIHTPLGSKRIYEHSHESPWPMTVPLIILGFGSIFVGYLFRDIMLGFGTPFFGNAIYISNFNTIEAEFIPTLVKWTPVIFSISGAIAGVLLYHSIHIHWKSYNTWLYTFLNNKWHFDMVYNHYIAKPVLRFSHDVSYKVLDRGLIEYLGPTGIVRVIKVYTSSLSKLQSGRIYNYGLIMLISVSVFIGFKLLSNNIGMEGIKELLIIIIGVIIGGQNDNKKVVK